MFIENFIFYWVIYLIIPVGTVPATESAFDVFNDESKGHGNLHKHSDRNVSTAEKDRKSVV